MSPFAPEKTYTYSETRKRTSSDYVKWSPDYRLVLRVINPNARLVWKHWIPEANSGRGMFAVCPNVDAQTKVCPICKSLVGRDKEDPDVQQRRVKKRFIVNVLERTPYTVCPACNESTPKAKACTNCSVPLKANLEYAPLNKVKVLEGGPQLFTQTFNSIEKSQSEDYPGAEITDYDITFTVNGTGRDRKIAGIPQPPKLDANDKVVPTPEEWFIDPETGERQKEHDLEYLTEVNTVAEVEALLAGGGVEQINELRGVA